MNIISKVVLACFAKLPTYLPFILTCINIFSCAVNDVEHERVRATYKEALSFYQKEKYAEAEFLLVENEALQSNSAEVQQLLGLIRVAQINDGEAVLYFRAALRIDRKHSAAWLALIQAELRLGNLDKALQTVEKAGKLFPNNVRLTYERGQNFAKMGKFDLAATEFEKAAQSDSTFLKVFYALGNAYNRLGQTARADSILELYEDLAEKTRDLDLDLRVVDLNPESADAHYNLARAHEKMKDYPAAIREYHKALKLNPEFPQAANNLGIIYFRFNQLNKARGAFEQAVSWSDTTAKYHFNLGTVYARLGNVKNAGAQWEMTLMLDPNHQKARNFVEALKKQGAQFKEAPSLK